MHLSQAFGTTTMVQVSSTMASRVYVILPFMQFYVFPLALLSEYMYINYTQGKI